MKLFIADTYEAMSKQAAQDLITSIQSVKKPLICPASGASPTGLYKALVELIKTSGTDTSNWYFVSLDEWKGMNGNDEGSCRDYLNKHLFEPLNVNEQQICFFDGRANDLNKECEKAEDFIKEHGGIDVATLGIGVNGHIGMNEPGTSASVRAHVAAIHKSTQQIGQKYFKQPKQINAGITVGLATLLEAKHLMLLVSGTSKAVILNKMLHEPVSEAIPATLLRNHSNFYVYADAEAAKLLRDN
ncbi:MAG: glucosamine-6-phosphate deaminase [Parafilimonas sp.]